MNVDIKRPGSVAIISTIMCIFGLMMLGYWAAYIYRGMSLKDVPLLSEILTALAAITAGYGLYKMSRWGYVLSLVVAGMWIYAVVNGIFLLLMERFAVASPVGPASDFFAFILTMMFSVYLIIFLWKQKALFE